MFYRLDKNNNIIDNANFKYAEDCLETDKNIVRDFNGKLVFEEETLTQEYLTAKQNLETKQDNQERIAKLTNKLVNTDYIANKLAEAVSKYISTGDNTDVLLLREKYALELADRETWRNEVDSLQEKLKKL